MKSRGRQVTKSVPGNDEEARRETAADVGVIRTYKTARLGNVWCGGLRAYPRGCWRDSEGGGGDDGRSQGDVVAVAVEGGDETLAGLLSELAAAKSRSSQAARAAARMPAPGDQAPISRRMPFWAGAPAKAPPNSDMSSDLALVCPVAASPARWVYSLRGDGAKSAPSAERAQASEGP